MALVSRPVSGSWIEVARARSQNGVQGPSRARHPRQPDSCPALAWPVLVGPTPWRNGSSVPFLNRHVGRMRGRDPPKGRQTPAIRPSQMQFARPVSVGQTWGTSGPQRAPANPDSGQPRAKPLVKPIRVGRQKSCERYCTSAFRHCFESKCPSQRHLAVRERGVEPPTGREATCLPLGVLNSSWTARRGSWGRRGARLAT